MGFEPPKRGQFRDPEIVVVDQPQPLGLGHAILCTRPLTGDEPIAVLLPDELLLGEQELLASMLEHHERDGTSLVSLLQVSPEAIAGYGCAEIGGNGPFGTLLVTGCIEKPRPENAPSNEAICGRYVLGPDALDALESVAPDTRGEIQLTPALDSVARAGGLIGQILRPEDGRVDVGNWPGWFLANCQIFAPAIVSGNNAARPNADRDEVFSAQGS